MMRTKGEWYFLMAVRWGVGIAAVFIGRWMISLWQWPWWAGLLADFLLLTLTLAFVIQWPLSYGRYVQFHDRIAGGNPDRRPNDD
jgi:uncharacterized protein (DUF58 family)